MVVAVIFTTMHGNFYCFNEMFRVDHNFQQYFGRPRYKITGTNSHNFLQIWTSNQKSIFLYALFVKQENVKRLFTKVCEAKRWVHCCRHKRLLVLQLIFDYRVEVNDILKSHIEICSHVRYTQLTGSCAVSFFSTNDKRDHWSESTIFLHQIYLIVKTYSARHVLWNRSNKSATCEWRAAHGYQLSNVLS